MLIPVDIILSKYFLLMATIEDKVKGSVINQQLTDKLLKTHTHLQQKKSYRYIG